MFGRKTVTGGDRLEIDGDESTRVQGSRLRETLGRDVTKTLGDSEEHAGGETKVFPSLQTVLGYEQTGPSGQTAMNHMVEWEQASRKPKCIQEARALAERLRASGSGFPVVWERIGSDMKQHAGTPPAPTPASKG
jgi:hypothetical protein